MVSPIRIAEPPLARYGMDRDGVARRDPALFDALLADPRTRVLPFHHGLAPSLGNSLLLLSPDDVTSAQLRVYLGRSTISHAPAMQPMQEPGTPILLEVLSDAAFRDLDVGEARWVSLRQCGADLNPRDAGLYTQALALANWHDTHRFCPKCGEPNLVIDGGWARRCFVDEYQVFPRIDPAVIMAVRDGADRLLLGGGRPGWYSVLAGFVEPGESLEAAVVREVHEEANLTVTVDGYLGSQAWPFPLSLMLAFSAVADEPDVDAALTPDGDEIDHLEFFSREEFARRVGSLQLPGRASIARAMIEAWFGGAFTAANDDASTTPSAPAAGGYVAGTDIPDEGVSG